MTDSYFYDREFYSAQANGSRRSAAEVLPLVLDLIPVRSLVDVGCGVGTWLAEAHARGVEDFLGVDGDYVSRDQLQIPSDRFLDHDLTQPLRLDREFDLVLSLEVAEHLPFASAEAFVESLARLGSVVLFSAAIPGQGGVNHINEQWPTYWADLFSAHGFVAVDYLRPRLWFNNRVEAYYAQNVLLYLRKSYLAELPDANPMLGCVATRPLSLVHPLAYVGVVNHFHPDNISVRRAIRQLGHSIRRAVTRRATGYRSSQTESVEVARYRSAVAAVYENHSQK